MLDKDKLHMVFYIGTKDNAYTKTSSDLLQIVEDINTSIPTDGSVQKYFIVDKNSNDIKVECINPIYISDEMINERIENILTKVRKNLNKNCK